jgi:chemotaxis methyl-accepting protein methylase
MVPPPSRPAPADQDERGFRALTQKISQARGVTCEAYKEKCLRRRIAVRMRARGVHTFDDYSRLLDQDAKEYERLLDALTINVTKFYRNPETWTALARPHLADLWIRRNGAVRVWSAGCASGEEPYTLAVLLAEAARLAGDGAALARARIDATDIDRVSLERSQAAQYDDAAFTEMPPELVRRYFSADKPRRPIEDIRRIVHTSRNDLTRDPAPRPPYDLVVCRNVVIYFDRVTQERLFSRFIDALAPGGLLVLGKVETLFGGARERLEMLDPRERIYRRPLR